MKQILVASRATLYYRVVYLYETSYAKDIRSTLVGHAAKSIFKTLFQNHHSNRCTNDVPIELGIPCEMYEKCIRWQITSSQHFWVVYEDHTALYEDYGELHKGHQTSAANDNASHPISFC